MKTLRSLLVLAFLAPLAACDTYEGESEYDVAPGTAVDADELEELNEQGDDATQNDEEDDDNSSSFEGECGDAIVTEGEECDDGVMNGDNAACTAACQIAVCGDGLLYADGEECDEGAANGASTCDSDCQLMG